MLSEPHAAPRHSCRRAAGILIIAGLAMLSVLLVGCETGVQAGGRPGSSLAQNAQPPALTPLPTGADGWNDAGQVTVTPAAGESAPAAGSDAATPPSDNAQPVQFAGPVENLPGTGDWSGPWQVAGRLVHVTTTTQIDQRRGRVAVGTQVAVEGWQQPDGSVNAGWIIVLGANGTGTPEPVSPVPAIATPGPAAATNPPPAINPGQNNEPDNRENGDQGDINRPVKPIEFRGTVEQMPGSGLVGAWRISGRTVNVNAHTRVQQKQGALATGAYVQVMGWQQPDGSINAASIQVKKLNNGANGRGNQDGESPGNGNGKGNNGKGDGQGNGKGKDHK